jgi:hypothetical protein
VLASFTFVKVSYEKEDEKDYFKVSLNDLGINK